MNVFLLTLFALDEFEDNEEMDETYKGSEDGVGGNDTDEVQIMGSNGIAKASVFSVFNMLIS